MPIEISLSLVFILSFINLKLVSITIAKSTIITAERTIKPVDWVFVM